MLEYFQVGIVLFLLWCLIIPILTRAPSRLKFYVTIVAMTVWLVPWHLVSLNIPQLANSDFSKIKNEKVLQVGALVDSIYRPDRIPTEKTGSAASNLDRVYPGVNRADVRAEAPAVSFFIAAVAAFKAELNNILIGAFAFGVLLFMMDLFKFRRQMKVWLRDSKNGDHLARKFGFALNGSSIRILARATPGMATGIRQPVIWLSEEVRDPAHQKTIILHELVHIQNRDTRWIWFINFSKRLLWWNPLVWFLARRAVDYMEYSCDETCDRQLSDSEYRASLAELIVGQDSIRPISTVLGIYKGNNLNVLRVKALGIRRQLGITHVGVAASAATVALLLCLVLVNDGHRRLSSAVFLSAQTSFDNLASLVEVPASQAAFFNFAESIRKQDFRTAEAFYSDLLKHYESDRNFELYDRESRILAFRIMAMYLGDTGQYQEILDLYPTILKPDVKVLDTHVSRILAIAHIRQQDYDAAIDVLTEADDIHVRSGPSTVLKAQAYHLKGEYRKSEQTILAELSEFERQKNYYESRVAILRLLGKNLVLMGERKRLKGVIESLGDYAPADFLAVKADKPQIPYVYFTYQSVAGFDVEAVDERQFPLPEQAPQTEINKLKRVFNLAAIYSRYGQYRTAVEVVNEGLLNLKDRITLEERLKALEYLFALSILAEDMDGATSAARKLEGEYEINPSILARVYYVLAMVGTGNTLDDRERAYFNKYLALLNEPSPAADHETIKLYSTAEDPSPAQDAVFRTLSFYQSQRLVPDIKILNSIIEIFEKLDQKEEAMGFRAVLAANYPRAYNFIYE